MPPKITAPVRGDWTTKIWEIPVNGAVKTSTKALPLETTSAPSGDGGGASNGRVFRIEVSATKLNAKVHCGTVPMASLRDKATNGVAAAPTTVAVVAAIMEEEPKTAAAHPTKHPLYPRRPFWMDPLSRPKAFDAAVAVTVPRAAKLQR